MIHFSNDAGGSTTASDNTFAWYNAVSLAKTMNCGRRGREDKEE